jgi:hypothetical protein
MLSYFRKMRIQTACCISSILVHLLVVQAMGLFAHYDFAAAVGNPKAVLVDLAGPGAPEPAAAAPEQQPSRIEPAPQTAGATTEKAQEAQAKAPAPEQAPAEPESEPETESDNHPAEAKPTDLATPADKKQVAAPSAPHPVPASAQTQASAASSNLGAVSGFVGSNYEKLSYRITMRGLPIGSAELESKNENGITTITLRVKSTPAISSFYPVDDVVETQQISGLYVMAKIKQHEGDFRSDETFTINQRTRSVRWYDLVHPRIVTTTVPNNQVMDSLSGIYYLRARDLQVGRNETLHIYDAETYAEVPVEILRREEIRLPNLKKVPTLVVRPLQKTAGIFRRTGDLLIWMTDDRFKVPVRIDTTMALGKVSCELVSAESGKGEKDVKP